MKKILIILLTLFVVLGVFVSCRYEAISEEKVVSPEEQIEKGVISTKEGLKLFRDMVNAGDSFENKTITLSADIDLEGEEWTPIGDTHYRIYDPTKDYCRREQDPKDEAFHRFAGTFDGNGHTIKGLKITSVNEEDRTKEYLTTVGLFGIVKKGEIKNLTVYGDILSADSAAGIVGGVVGEETDTFVISNCNSYVNVVIDPNTNEYFATAFDGVKGQKGHLYLLYGTGILAQAKTGTTTIENCKNYGTISTSASLSDRSTYYKESGILGANWSKVVVKNCENHGELKGAGMVGGIIAQTSGAIEIDSVTNFGKISAASEVYFVGGIIGNMMSNTEGTIIKARNEGMVNAEKGSVGGVIGAIGGIKSSLIVTDSGNVGELCAIAGGITGSCNNTKVSYNGCYINDTEKLADSENEATGKYPK